MQSNCSNNNATTWTVNAFVFSVVVALLLLWLLPANKVFFILSHSLAPAELKHSSSCALWLSYWQRQRCVASTPAAAESTLASITVAACAATSTTTAKAEAKVKAKRRNYVYSCRTHFILFIFILFVVSFLRAQLFRIFRSSLSTHRRVMGFYCIEICNTFQFVELFGFGYRLTFQFKAYEMI